MARNNKRQSMRDKIKKKAKESGSGANWINSKLEYFQPKKGKSKFDILPYTVSIKDHPDMEKGDLWYNKTVYVHYNIGAEGNAYVCPLKTAKKPCPICEYRNKLMRDDDVDEDVIKDLKPKQRDVFNVRVKGEKEVKLFTTSHYVFGKLLLEEILENEEDGYDSFADMEGGKTLTVKFREKEIGSTKFLEASNIEFNDRNDLKESILKKVEDLDKIIVYEPYEAIEKALFETADEDGAKKGKKGKKGKSGTCDECGEDMDDCTCNDTEICEECGEELEDCECGSSGGSDDEICDECGEDLEDCTCGDGGDDDGSTQEDECPFDHKFPNKCDKTDDCDECPNWDYCRGKKDELIASRKK